MFHSSKELLDALPPHNAEAERGALGSILFRPPVFDMVAGILKPADFYLEANQRVYRAMLALRRDDVAIDSLTLADALAQRGELEAVGGKGYLVDILESCPTAANAKHYANIVRDDSCKRQIRRLAERILVDSTNGRPTDDLLASIRCDIDGIGATPKVIETALAQAGPIVTCLADIEPRPIAWLWRGRIPLGRITLFVGRPGEGKSFLATDMAARVTTATPWPDGCECPMGSVILISAEDDPHDTIRPRLDAHYADVRRVHLLSAVRRVDAAAAKKWPRESQFCLPRSPSTSRT